MRRFLLSLTAILALSISVSANADTLVTYDFSGAVTFAGSQLTGSLTIDTTVGTITDINAAYVGVPYNAMGVLSPQNNTFTGPGSILEQNSNFFGDGYVAFFNSDQGDPGTPGGAQIALLLPYDYLTGYPGSLICADEYTCNNVISTVYYYDATANTPTHPYSNSSDAFCSGGLGVIATPYDPTTGCVGGSQPVIDNGPTVTPEPSSLVLLGSGMVGLAGMVRRRIRR